MSLFVSAAVSHLSPSSFNPLNPHEIRAQMVQWVDHYQTDINNRSSTPKGDIVICFVSSAYKDIAPIKTEEEWLTDSGRRRFEGLVTHQVLSLRSFHPINLKSFNPKTEPLPFETSIVEIAEFANSALTGYHSEIEARMYDTFGSPAFHGIKMTFSLGSMPKPPTGFKSSHLLEIPD